MIKQLIIVSYIFFAVSCASQKNNSLNKKTQTAKEQLFVLKNQLEFGRPSFDNPYKYTINDLNAVLPEIKKILLFNDYKSIKNDHFYKKVQQIFNRKLDLKSKSVYVNFLDECNYNPKYSPNDLVDYYGFFIITKENFITENFSIPQIIDYKNLFNEALAYENTLESQYKNENDETINKYFWKDDINLEQERAKNNLILVARNKFLFNDDKNQLLYLLENDSYFMKKLVTNFGYVEDKELLKWVVNKFDFQKNNFQEMGQLLWKKKCNNTFEIHEKTLNMLQLIISPENKVIIDSVNKYIAYLLQNQSKTSALSVSEKSKLIAYLVHFVEQYRYKTDYNDKSMAVQNLLNLDVKKVYLNEIKKNNYYNLPKFKEWLAK